MTGVGAHCETDRRRRAPVMAGYARGAARRAWCRRLLAVGTVAVAVGVGCGRKAPVRPPEYVVPKTIDDLKATNEADGVQLAWRRPLEYADGTRMDDLGGFVVERASGDVDFATLTTLDVGDRDRFRKIRGFRYLDRDVAEGTRYRYRVTSFTTDQYIGAPSNTVEIARAMPAATPTRTAGSATPAPNTR